MDSAEVSRGHSSSENCEGLNNNNLGKQGGICATEKTENAMV